MSWQATVFKATLCKQLKILPAESFETVSAEQKSRKILKVAMVKFSNPGHKTNKCNLKY